MSGLQLGPSTSIELHGDVDVDWEGIVSVAVVAKTVRRGRLVPLAIGVAAGTVMTAFFMRRELLTLAARASPYVRRRSRISNPALIVNR